MPIKIPKGFPRRKSSGNALDELPKPPEPSFRVIERPDAHARSYEGGQTSKRISHVRTLSASHLNGDNLLPNNRSSGGTNHSASSGGHDNSSISARFSSTSTLPSSTDVPLDDRPLRTSKDTYNMPAPQIPETSSKPLRAAGRAFSFGRRKAESNSTPPRPTVEQSNSDATPYTRERAMTESSYASGSTATPPKLLDTKLDLEQSDDAFGSMFENFGKRNSQGNFDQGAVAQFRTQSPERMSPGSYAHGNQPTMTPAPLNVDRKRDIEPPQPSWASNSSKDGLVNSSSPMERTFSYEDDAAFTRAGEGSPQARGMPANVPLSSAQRRTQQRTPSSGLARSSVYGGKSASNGDSLDVDARLVMDSINASKKLDRRYSSAGYSDDDDNATAALVPQSSHPSSPYAAQGPSRMPENRRRSSGPTFDSSDRNFTTTRQQGSAETTPRPQKSGLVYHDENSLFDAPTHSARQAPVFRPKIQPPARPQTQNKIMTPAQFEQYRREQEMTSTAQPRGKQDISDDDDDYEDDDEMERARQAARQRKKQEAHMSIYRQQMMKMTGEQPSDLPSIQLRPAPERVSMSTPNLQSIIPDFSFDKPSESGKASDEDDDDVPLGVLAAHGFPSKNRPPTAASNNGMQIQYKSESYPPPSSSASVSGGGRSSTLPAFARNLPPDPYFGAGLVNPSNRESLAFGTHAPRSSQAGSQTGSPVPGPPGGLVGVINAEERARAARRGSPNAHGQFGSPLPLGMIPPTMGMPPMMTPADQATAQMSEQMNQMMQMQMQWMQQMQAMMAGGGMMQPGQQPPFMPGMPPGMSQEPQMMMMQPGMGPPPPGHGQQPRPMSAGSHSAPGPPGRQQPQQRAMSMMAPGPAGPWPPNRKSVAPSMMSGALDSQMPGYAGSIAPSERSNVGMPSRYRPVSIAPADEHGANSRSSTFTDGTLQPGGLGLNNRLSTSGDRTHSRLSSLRPASTSPQPARKGHSDDDDEEGWAEMKNKRDKKKSMWRMTRKSRAEEKPDFDVYDYPAEGHVD